MIYHPAEDTVSDSSFSQKGFISCLYMWMLRLILKRHFKSWAYNQFIGTVQEEKVSVKMSELEKESQRIDHILYSASYQNLREREREEKARDRSGGWWERGRERIERQTLAINLSRDWFLGILDTTWVKLTPWFKDILFSEATVLWTILQHLLEVKYNLFHLTCIFWTLPQQAPQKF